MRSEYTTLIETDKEKYLCSLGSAISDPKSCTKKYWSAMKKILKKNITSVIPPILHSGMFITNIKEKCQIFNNYFKDQCKTIVTSSILPPQIDKTTNLSLQHVNFTESKILEHIRGLNINKAHGHDGIPIRILKICDNTITKPLFIIFKNCVKRGYFPKRWKKANVVPVYKKNERNLTIGLSLYYQYVAKYLKKLYLTTCTHTSFRTILFPTINWDIGTKIPRLRNFYP